MTVELSSLKAASPYIADFPSRLLKKTFVRGTSPNPRANRPESTGEPCSLFRQRAGATCFGVVPLFAISLALAGCMDSAGVRNAVPQALVENASVAGYGSIQLWGDDRRSVVEQEVVALRKERIAAARVDPTINLREMNSLTLSGGGSSGAFGAGILTGWTKRGGRPEFDVVTGISTGALIAPLAFLGPAYDKQLSEAFTSISGSDIYERKSIVHAVLTASFASNAPLRRMIDRYVTDDVMDQIAREHAKGRRLLIGTTNLDADRPVIWNMGAIALSNAPGKKRLFQDILLASASVPGAFPPVEIEVNADGRSYDEVHVDGGASNQVFFVPAGLPLRNVDPKLKFSGIKNRLYIIRNGRTSPEFSVVKLSLLSLADKSISSLLKREGIGDLYRMFAIARRDDIDYNFIDIPDSFTQTEDEPFDPKYMNALYRTGYEMGRTGVPWEKVPPGYED